MGVRGARRCARKPGNNVIEMVKGGILLGIMKIIPAYSNVDGEAHSFTYVRCICIGHPSASVCGTCPQQPARWLHVMN